MKNRRIAMIPAVSDAPASGARVPIVSAVSFGVVDKDGGGQRIVVTVDSSTGCTAINAGGVPFSAFAIDDAAHVSGIPGAHAPGVVDVVVTNAAGDSTTGAGLIEYADASTLLGGTAVFRAPYAGVPWIASGGSVGGTMGGGAPATPGTPLGGFATADFVGGEYVRSSAFYEELVSISGSVSSPPGPGYTLACLFFARTAAADDPAAPYSNPGLISTNAGGYVILGFSDAGLRVACFDGAYKQTPPIACSTGAWHLAQVVHDGATLKGRVDGGAWQSVAAALPSVVADSTYSINVGSNYATSLSLDGRIAEVATSKIAVSVASLDKYRSLLAQRYGVPV